MVYVMSIVSSLGEGRSGGDRCFGQKDVGKSFSRNPSLGHQSFTLLTHLVSQLLSLNHPVGHASTDQAPP